MEHITKGSLPGRIGLTGTQLKWIAIVSMLMDHIGAVLLPQYIFLRIIGRIAFPIFVFLSTEGFFHTRNIQRYFLNLAVFAVVSEIPFDLAFRQEFFYWEHQNVFLTLAIGVGLMYALEQTTEWPVKGVEILLAMWFAEILRTDYGYHGILLIALLYLLRKSRIQQVAADIIWNFLGMGSAQWFGGLSGIAIALYNGKRGRGMKYFFYAFYPVHLMILYLVKRYI